MRIMYTFAPLVNLHGILTKQAITISSLFGWNNHKVLKQSLSNIWRKAPLKSGRREEKGREWCHMPLSASLLRDTKISCPPLSDTWNCKINTTLWLKLKKHNAFRMCFLKSQAKSVLLADLQALCCRPLSPSGPIAPSPLPPPGLWPPPQSHLTLCTCGTWALAWQESHSYRGGHLMHMSTL